MQTVFVEMMIKDLGARVESVWEGLRPVTKKMIFGALQANTASAPVAQTQKFSYDTQSDWELSRLLIALDEQLKDESVRKDAEKFAEINQLAETLVKVLEAQTESAEVFIQLAERLLKRNDFVKFDKLTDALAERFSAGEIAEIIRQTDLAQIRAVSFETLSLMNSAQLVPLLDDPLYYEIARNALEQQAFEYESEEAREILEQMEFGFED